MALIKCPNCGEEISERAEKCVHCGAEIPKPEPEPTVLRCEECGTELEPGVSVCPKCGCPVDRPEASDEEKPQKVEVTNVNLKVSHRVRNIMIGVIIIAVAGVAAFYGIRNYENNKALQEYNEALQEYYDTMEKAFYAMVEGASTAETEANLIHDVWYNTIYEEESSQTDKYTKDSSGEFYDDFNTSLLCLMISDDYREASESIQENQEEVQNLMKELKNPPEEYEDAYEALKEFYDAYIVLTNLATDPSGNLSSYTSSLNEADSNAGNCCEAMMMYLEDEEG